MVGFFESKEGDKSMARLIAFVAMCSGVALAAAGVILKEGNYVAMGAGLIGSAEALKVVQKTVEK